MFGLTTATRIFLGEDPLSGRLFLFTNRQQTCLKVLVLDGSGLWVCAKRLEKGRFAWPKPQPGTARLLMRPEEQTVECGQYRGHGQESQLFIAGVPS